MLYRQSPTAEDPCRLQGGARTGSGLRLVQQERPWRGQRLEEVLHRHRRGDRVPLRDVAAEQGERRPGPTSSTPSATRGSPRWWPGRWCPTMAARPRVRVRVGGQAPVELELVGRGCRRQASEL